MDVCAQDKWNGAGALLFEGHRVLAAQHDVT
jgi:hypothetical protein